MKTKKEDAVELEPAKSSVEAEPAKAPAKTKASKGKKTESKKLKVTLIKSTIACLENQKRTVQALGLKKIRSTAIHNDTPVLQGMLNVVKHLVKVEEVK